MRCRANGVISCRKRTRVAPLPDAGAGRATVDPATAIAYTRAVMSEEPGAGRGVFIAIEGPDGSGKSTLAARIGDALRAGGCDVLVTREPGSTPLGERLRHLVLDTDPPIERTGVADALLFAAARAQHVAEVIRPALARGAVVVCDRFSNSSMAYQGHGSGVPLDALATVQRLATDGLRPDLTIVLDLPVEAGLGRKAAEVTRFEANFDLEYHERVRAAFLGFAAAEPDRYAIVEATGSPQAVLDGSLAAIDRLARRMPCLVRPAVSGGVVGSLRDDEDR